MRSLGRSMVVIGWFLEVYTALVVALEVLSGQTLRAAIAVLALFLVDWCRRRNSERLSADKPEGDGR